MAGRTGRSSRRARGIEYREVAWRVAGALLRDLHGGRPDGTAGGSRDYRAEPLEQRCLLSATPIISEFQALNSNGITDEDGSHSDWIELYNPTSADVNLNGYFLTDNAADLTEWRMPAATLPSGGFLVVFADGKNRTDLTHPLHTNFSLNGSGEYLALVAPDGQTVLSSYDYPQQLPDISYGVGITQTDTHFIAPSATAHTLVPTDGSLGNTWTQPVFNDAAWMNGTTGVGYETETPIPTQPGFSVHMIDTQGGTDGQLTDISKATALLNGTSPPGAFTIAFDGTADRSVVNLGDGGDFGGDLTLPNGLGGSASDNTTPGRTDYALRILANVTIPAGQYTIDVNSDDGFRLRIPGVTFTNRVNENFTGATNPSPADTLVYGATRAPGDTLGTFTVPAGGLTTSINLDYYEHTGGDDVELSVASGFRTGFSTSTFSLLTNGTLGWQVIDPNGPTSPNYRTLIGTDVQAQMYNTGQNTAYIRLPFTVVSPSDFDTVRLRMKYDDGFVAYLNGQEVMRRNAPATLAFNSSATATHADTDALVYETISLPASDLLAGANVLAIQGLNSANDQSDFLIYPELDSITSSFGAAEYFLPTPGAINGQPYAQGIVSNPKFDHTHGFYTTPFALTLTDDTPGAQIRYTLDGTVPTATTGIAYTGPISITGTSNVRAAAFQTGYAPSTVETETFIFTADVIHQSPTGQPPPGWPSSWGANVVDYGMDPRVVTNPAYSSEIQQDLLAIPTYSVTMNLNDLFNPSTGIYANATQDGRAWEKPASIELINPDGTPGYQIDAGIRIRGGFSRSAQNPKHAFRLFFRSDYGQSTLDYPAFGSGAASYNAAQSFQEFDLRCDENYSWSFQGDPREIGIRDQFARNTQLAMGEPGERGDLVFLYINGQFWGLYNTDERPEAKWAASYFGGTKDGYDTIKVDPAAGYTIYATDGNMDAWTQLYNQMLGGMSTDAAYQRVQGNNPDGTRNPNYPDLLDVDNLIDYMLLIYYTGNLDAPNSSFVGNNPNNFFAVRPEDGSFGFRFMAHDSEHILLDVNQNRVNSDNPTHPLSTSNPGWFFQVLEANPNFRLRVADHIQQMFFDGGPLTVQANMARFTALANEVHGPIVDESARWGDAKRPSQPFTRNVEWQTEITRIETQYIPQRTNIVLNQLKAVGLYPSTAAPTYSQFGGVIAPGYQLTITNPNGAGTVYYTLDGSDPWLPGGAISPTALVYSGPITLNQTTTVKARVLNGTIWSALENANFSVNLNAVRITEVMYNPAPPAAGGPYTASDFEYIELQNTGNTPVNLINSHFASGVTFTFGDTVLAPGERTVIVSNRTAFQSRYGGAINIAGSYSGHLANTSEELKLVGPANQTIVDFTYQSSWYPLTNGGGYSLVLRDATAPQATWSTKQGWRTSNDLGGNPEAPDNGINPDSIVINELLTRTSQPGGDWIELANTTNSDIDISGWFLSDSAANLQKYEMPSGTIVMANGYLVLHAGQSFDLPGAPGVQTPFTFSADGTDVYLSSVDASGNVGGYREHERVGASDPEVSFGRYQLAGGGTDFTAMTAPTPGGPNSAPRLGAVVLNELMYNPPLGFSEYIELHNTTSQPVPLFDPANPQYTWKFTDGIVYSLPPNVTIPPFGYIVLSGPDPATLRSQYVIPAGVQVYGPYVNPDGSNRLNNSGENLELSRPVPSDTPGVEDYVATDHVHYGVTAPWPVAADGSGASLSRIDGTHYGNDYTTWAAEPPHGSPGRTNFDVTPPTVQIVPVSDPRTTAVSNINIVFSEPVRGFDMSDLLMTLNGFGNVLGSGQTLTTSDGITWVLSGLSSITSSPGTYVLALTAAGSGIQDFANNPLGAGSSITWHVVQAATVVGRYVFYNNSRFDGNDQSAAASDDAAIATDKTALMPGNSAVFSNYTSYSRGLNGIMIDVANLSGAPTAGDFVFLVGNTSSVASWVAAPAPSHLLVRPGAGVNGSTRIDITWADNVIQDEWLQVTVQPDVATGLALADVFYFGNAIGESGNSPTDALVTSDDELAARNDPHNFLQPAAITNPHDYNRDGRVDAIDQIIARNNVTTPATGLNLVAVPVPAPTPAAKLAAATPKAPTPKPRKTARAPQIAAAALPAPVLSTSDDSVLKLKSRKKK